MPPLGVPNVQMFQLHGQDLPLQALHPVVEPDLGVMMPRCLGVVTEPPDPGGDLGVVGDYRTGLPSGTEILTGIEGETCHVAEAADSPAAQPGAVCLGGVVDHRQVVPVGEILEQIQPGGVAVEIHRQQCPGRGRDHRLRRFRVEVAGSRVDVGEHRPGSAVRDRPGRRYPAQGRRHHLVTFADSRRQQSEVKGRGAGVDTDAMVALRVGGEAPLEILDVLAQDEGSLVDHLGDGSVDVGADGRILRSEIDEGDSHHPSPPPRPRKRAGLPATVDRGATSAVTTAPAPTMASRPIVTPGSMTAPEPMLAPRSTRVGMALQSSAACNRPSGVVARGRRSLVNTT